jgi:ribosomal protein S18 acetylase RimI-like enzyme
MTAGDLPTAMRLVSQAGWNQLEADWRRFLAMQPDGCFVAEADGESVGTTVVCIFDDIAWIAMVLVDTAVRGRGIGTALLNHAMAFLDGRGVRSIRLDATPLGEPIYTKLGFDAEYAVARYEGALPAVGDYANGASEYRVTTAKTSAYAQILALDRSVSGTDRGKFLERLLKERPEAVQVIERSSQIVGYLTIRPGRNAVQLGPCVGSPEVTEALVADAAVRYAGQRVFLDVPVRNTRAVRLAEDLGLTVQRTFTRMCRGVKVREDKAQLFASSGPELG